MFNIVLVEPEIPNNTGNIGRTCVGTDCTLHLVEPFGFEISDKQLKRAGLDYWPYLKWKTYGDFSAWKASVSDPSRVFFFSKKSERSFFEVEYQPGDWFVYGKETKGLSDEILNQHAAQTVTIPMFGPIRSLNLANAVSVAIYEGIRQVSSTRHNDNKFLEL